MAQALAVLDRVPQVGPLCHRDDVVRVSLTLGTAHPPALSAGVRIAEKHGQPPCLVPIIAVPSGRSVRPLLSSPHLGCAARQAEHLDPLWHRSTLERDRGGNTSARSLTGEHLKVRHTERRVWQCVDAAERR